MKINLLQVESRWLLAGVAAVAILLLTYIGDIETMLHESSVLQSDINDVREQINLESTAKKSESFISQDEYIDISELLHFIEDKQAVLQETDENQYSLEMTVRDKAPLQQLLDILISRGNKYFIDDFNLSVSEAKEFHLMVDFEVDQAVDKTKSIKMHDLSQLPFCQFPTSKQMLPDQAWHYALKDLHLLGTLRNQRGNRVLVGFPNGVTQIMSPGDRLGSEGAVIMRINTQSIMVKLPDNKEILCGFSVSCSL